MSTRSPSKVLRIFTLYRRAVVDRSGVLLLENNKYNNKKPERRSCRTFSSSASLSTEQQQQQPFLTLSPITEPPLDCQVIEKPCTILLMEDQDTRSYDNTNTLMTTSSWRQTFQSKLPYECGISFASLSFPGQSDNESLIDDWSKLKISDCVTTMKSSNLPLDTVLVTRGWFSSTCALYYLESLSLQGLIMIDPISFHSTNVENNSPDDNVLQQYILREHSIRFEDLNELKLEPNAVPMLVVSTIPLPSWLQAAQTMADCHSDPDGPYGIVPVVDFNFLHGDTSQRWNFARETVGDAVGIDAQADSMVQLIDQWIEEEVL
ncbi:hypothetical protein IV203_028920 [Nitzschia inconspicua]|uniref:Uncharacterized protein n=1 Tax=Nitzschia inconspicua TaxID=303405 RepID=A0A9K3Q0Q9_9STRA|nr:hypothetical protein IV203_028920 [Nitzschia inconspicua]